MVSVSIPGDGEEQDEEHTYKCASKTCSVTRTSTSRPTHCGKLMKRTS